MASNTYLRKKKQSRTDRARKGGNARFEKYKSMHDPVPVGGFTTWGIMGDHVIRLLDCGDDSVVWIEVDGQIRAPRTLTGVKRIVSEWIWRKR